MMQTEPWVRVHPSTVLSQFFQPNYKDLATVKLRRSLSLPCNEIRCHKRPRLFPEREQKMISKDIEIPAKVITASEASIDAHLMRRSTSEPSTLAKGVRGAPTILTEPPEVAYLQSLFRQTGKGRMLLAEQHHHSSVACFTKPLQGRLDAYDLTVLAAIRSNDVELLQQLHHQGKSLDACNKFGESLLHNAARRSQLQVIKFLVTVVGCRLDVTDDYGRNAVHDACWTIAPAPDVMDFILRHVGNPVHLLRMDIRGHTPFHYARKEHHAFWLEYLTENKQLLLDTIRQC
jgi:hypothetical protein